MLSHGFVYKAGGAWKMFTWVVCQAAQNSAQAQMREREKLLPAQK
jgi:hypothetical protein